jgi:hypothetical protein
MNKPLAAIITCFLSATLLTLTMPAQESEAGFRRHCCGRAAHTRCHGRHFHRARYHGHYSGQVYHGSGYGCCGTYQQGCYGGEHHDGHANSYNEAYTEDQLPPAPREGTESPAVADDNEGGVGTKSPSGSTSPPPPPMP